MILRNPDGNNDVGWRRCFIIFPLIKVPDLAQDDLSQSGLLAPPHQRYGYPFPS